MEGLGIIYATLTGENVVHGDEEMDGFIRRDGGSIVAVNIEHGRLFDSFTIWTAFSSVVSEVVYGATHCEDDARSVRR